MDAPEHRHDPGGKVRLRLGDGITGDAAFSPCGRYRHALFRERVMLFDTGRPRRSALFIGMNPSMATATEDDPTCQREQAIAWREGCGFYIKVNVMDYRATQPGDLTRPGVVPRSDTNIEWITRFADAAQADGGFAVAAWGALPEAFQPYAEEALSVLLESGVPLFCLGLTKSGNPRHPLYLPANAPLLRFPGAPG